MTKLYVQLGRHGDILAVLPFLHDDFRKTGVKPRLMIAAECAPLLDGVTYVDRVIYEGPHYEIEKAVTLARTMADTVVCTQVNGHPLQVREFTYKPTGSESARATSFEKEMWRVAGKLSQWDDCLPLVIDQRDTDREAALLDKYLPPKKGKQKPLMLLALKSNSSPFPYADLLRELVTLKFQHQYRILELPQAERIYDLLALYEKAELLIAVDSAPLHLAWATPGLPVFALAQDRPILWNGSPWRTNHMWYCRYRDWPARATEMLSAIERPRVTGGDFVTVWNAYEDRTHYRVGPAVLPVYRGMCGRDSGNTLKDEFRHPYLKDVLRMAMQRAGSDDVQINLTRSNTSISPEVSKLTPPYWAYRLEKTKDGEAFKPVADLFCATRGWWKSALPEIPDFVLDEGHLWSQGLWAFFKSKGARDETGVCMRKEETK